MVAAVINVAPEGNLSRYLQEIRKFPMLAPEEELALSRQWRDNEDMDAAHKLVTSHLRRINHRTELLSKPILAAPGGTRRYLECDGIKL